MNLKAVVTASIYFNAFGDSDEELIQDAIDTLEKEIKDRVFKLKYDIAAIHKQKEGFNDEKIYPK